MAIKPNRTQAKQVYAFVNSTPTRRVQTFDWSSNFTIDSVFELGNAGIVEDAVTLVETGITLNSNEWGTTDLEAMVFGIFEQRNILGDGAVSGVLNAPTTLFVSAFGAGGDWTAAATGDWLQIIRFQASPTVNDSEYVKITAKSYVAASLSNKLTISSTWPLVAAPATGDIVSLINKYTIDQDTVDSNPVHFVLPHRHLSSATAIMHSVLLPRCYVDSLTYRFDTGGAAEQNYSLVGEEERLLLGSRREAQSVSASFMSYATGTAVLRIPIDSLAATGSPYIAYANSNLSTLKKITHVSGEATVSVNFGTGLSLDSTAQYIYYFTNITKVGYKNLTNIDSGIGKLTKGYVTVEMQQASGTLEKLQRCTGIDINMPLTRESIDEMGETRSIAKPLEGNIRNEVTLTFSRNDLREYAKLLGNQEAFDAETLTEILMTDLKAVKNITIVVSFYDSQTTHDATTLLKTMTFNSCNFIGGNQTTPISGAAGAELAFSTETLSIVGSGLPPQYS